MSDDGVGIHVIRDLQGLQRDRLLPEGNIEILDGGTLGFLLVETAGSVRVPA
jgi:Ni,Fe-hydrogenase maturation factor